MENLPIVEATSIMGYNPNLTMFWDDPKTGEQQIASGEFHIVNEQYSHIVADEDGNELYEVRGC